MGDSADLYEDCNDPKKYRHKEENFVDTNEDTRARGHQNDTSIISTIKMGKVRPNFIIKFDPQSAVPIPRG